jgi:hypothetical protein
MPMKMEIKEQGHTEAACLYALNDATTFTTNPIPITQYHDRKRFLFDFRLRTHFARLLA